MRYFALVLLLALASCKKEAFVEQEKFVKAKIIPSKIDSLNSKDEIEAYIRSKLDSDLPEFYLTDYSRIMTYHSSHQYIDSLNRIYAKQLGIDKTYYKTDFNNDGLTDLLLIGGWRIGNVRPKIQFYQFNSQIVINGGKGKSKTYSLARDYNFAFVPQIVETDSLPFIILHHPMGYDTVYPPRIKDTLQLKLVYKSGYFVEYNKKPGKHEIEKIEFTNVIGENSPHFQMILNKDDDSWFIAIFDNYGEGKTYQGAYKTEMSDIDFNELSDVLNYIDFENHQDSNSTYAPGQPLMALKITYDNNKVKEIYNNSGSTTYGLEAIYNKMLDLRFSQDWKQAEEPENMRLPRPQKRTKWN
ncbi:MAG: hypothetical protein DI539_01395 [Flavobacterium psychrophilum]|nr:MAG: hypothetical protein DI539_01395 [Flavobacterium psychrophilum]